MDLSGQCEQGKSGDLPDREHIAMMRSGRDVLCCWLIWDGGRSECIGQLLHSWKSASDSKSTAICQPSSDSRGIFLEMARRHIRRRAYSLRLPALSRLRTWGCQLTTRCQKQYFASER